MTLKMKSINLCNFVEFRFKTKHQLTNHSKRHEEFKPWVCTVCEKRFRVMYNLTVHMRSHNNINPYTCKYCDRKFRHTSSLKVKLERILKYFSIFISSILCIF